MFRPEIHPDAALNLNRRALSICKDTSVTPVSEIRSTKEATDTSPRSPDFHVSAVITEADIIGEITTGLSDSEGNKVTHEWYDESQRYSISEENYRSVITLATQLLKSKEIRVSLSRKAIEEIICDWVRQYSTGLITHNFVEFFTLEARKRVRLLQVFAPIRSLCIEKAFTLGLVRFEPIEGQRIDAWEKQAISRAPDRECAIKEFYERRIRPIQGYTAAMLEAETEEQRAHDLILEEAQRSLSLLRVFTQSSLLPNMTSPCVLWGTGHSDSSFILRFEGGEFSGLHEALLGPGDQPTVLSSTAIDDAYRIGLERVHEILLSENRSDLEQVVLEALLLYSRCTIAKDPADKLVYILVGLESVLLKDPNESIAQNLSERIAFLIARDLPKRKEIVQTTRDAYRIRSDFIHHGASPESLDTLREFMEIAWYSALALIGATRTLKSRGALIAELDDRRLS
ncbi:MAG: HEPN domain-containing protein [Gemmatimonadaceae bacterium]|nr:HEPN domain-containing protein [Gemmatimonadaceae bacterium]